MSDHRNQDSGYRGPALFSYGFRPFFLGASLFAGLAIPIWVAAFAGADSPAFAFPPRDWHVHEMVFGFLPAVITGFLLTAIPNWTDRPPIRGVELMALFALWLAGRLLIALPWVPSFLTAAVDAAFLVSVAGLVWREIAAGQSWSHAPVGGLITLYAGANVLFHALALSGAATDVSERMALSLLMLLLTVIGGRVAPAFTGEFLLDRGRTEQIPSFSRYDGLSIALVGLAGLSWTLHPSGFATAWMLILAGSANLGRLSRWRGWLTWREPLVLILHVGYGWLGAALVLLGCAILGIGLPVTDAVHGLTTGAVGVMTLAVMTRASLGHTGRMRHADPVTVVMYALVFVGALLRVAGPGTGLRANLVLGFAAVCWSGAYLLFAMVYGRYLLRPGLDEP